MNILLIQGANMEYLGIRQPEIYGTTTAQELDQIVTEEATRLGMNITIRYSNIEGEAINFIYAADRNNSDGLIMNPAGFHYVGHALADCLKAISMPFVEVHMSNIDRRGFRSVTAPEAAGMITGFGVHSYILGLQALHHLIISKR